MKSNAQRDERRVTNATSSVLLKALPKPFQIKLCRAHTMMTTMMISKRWLLCGEISQIANVLIEPECARVCVSVYCCEVAFFSLDSYFAFYPFNSIIQWCTSRQHRNIYTNTHMQHRRAPYSKHFYLCCSSIYDDYCLFLLYYYCQSFLYENKKKIQCTRFMPLNMISAQILALSRQR